MSSSAAAPTTPRGQSTDTSTTPGAPGKKKKEPHVFQSEGKNLSESGAWGDGAPQAGGRRRRRRKSKRKSRKKSHKKKRKTKRRRKSRKKRTKRRRRR